MLYQKSHSICAWLIRCFLPQQEVVLQYTSEAQNYTNSFSMIKYYTMITKSCCQRLKPFFFHQFICLGAQPLVPKKSGWLTNVLLFMAKLLKTDWIRAFTTISSMYRIQARARITNGQSLTKWTWKVNDHLSTLVCSTRYFKALVGI